MKRLSKEKKKHVCLSLEPSLVAKLKRLARRKGVRYQAMIREWLWEKVGEGG